MRFFLLTADARRLPQTLLPRDLRGKNHVNHVSRVIKLFIQLFILQVPDISIALSFSPIKDYIFLFKTTILVKNLLPLNTAAIIKPVCPEGMQVFLPTGRREEKNTVCACLRMSRG